jgi:hypothetical protein
MTLAAQWPHHVDSYHKCTMCRVYDIHIVCVCVV